MDALQNMIIREQVKSHPLAVESSVTHGVPTQEITDRVMAVLEANDARSDRHRLIHPDIGAIIRSIDNDMYAFKQQLGEEIPKPSAGTIHATGEASINRSARRSVKVPS
jgi:hypothetical protein